MSKINSWGGLLCRKLSCQFAFVCEIWDIQPNIGIEENGDDDNEEEQTDFDNMSSVSQRSAKHRTDSKKDRLQKDFPWLSTVNKNRNNFVEDAFKSDPEVQESNESTTERQEKTGTPRGGKHLPEGASTASSRRQSISGHRENS